MTTYRVTLIKLAPDAGSIARDAPKPEQRRLSAEEMLDLLRNFCAIDTLETATADPEIRVQSGTQSWLIRAGQKKLILYDVLNREAPAHILTPDEVMAELDGSAHASRTALPFTVSPWGQPEPVEPAAPEISRPIARVNVRRVAILATIALGLLGAIVALRVLAPRDDAAAGFTPLPAAEAAKVLASLAGVYVTGTQPGEHGIVLTATEEVRLIEFRAVDAPRLVHATADVGVVEGVTCLLTDQPGGLIRVGEPETLVYCGETYQRVR